VPADDPPLLPLELDPPDEPPDDPPPAGAAVPADGVSPPRECWASAVAGIAGSARAPIRIADERERVI
jgi:hypothetical protein